ncbi:MAG: NADH:flavin oxidoreductase [Myxococcales bacterium]|nr:NADH:flavin oxidoreductase [Myxococcales bacterium]
MWSPPERIRHPLPETRWPTAEEARNALLFQPLCLKSGLVLHSRTWVPAMVPWRASEDGMVTPMVLRWYERFAMGEPGVIVVEATGVRDIPSGPLLRIGDRRFLPGLAELVQTVRQASGGRTRLLIQLIDFLPVRRRPEPAKWFSRFWRPKPYHYERFHQTIPDAPDWKGDDGEFREAVFQGGPEVWKSVLTQREWEELHFGYRERITDTHLPLVRDLPVILPKAFADAASLAQEAGLDGVEIHCAHAYTLAGFLSALNDRTDGYGGEKENRIRLPLEVIEAVRNRVGEKMTVGCRFLGDEFIVGGSTVADAGYFGQRFAEAGVDFVSVSAGGKFEDAKMPKIHEAVYPYTGPSGYACMPTVLSDERGPFGRNVYLAQKIRSAIRDGGWTTPVVTAGGIATFELAEKLLQEQCADLIGSARQSLADPDWFKKVQLGLGYEVRRCKFTNYCEGLDQKHKQVTCQLWDRADKDDPNVDRTSDGRRLVAPAWTRSMSL